MFEPTSFDDFGEMVSSLKFSRAFMVKAPADKVLRRRLVDFLSGAAAASDADFERVSSDMYAITWGSDPTALREMVDQLLVNERVDVTGDDVQPAAERSAFGRPLSR